MTLRKYDVVLFGRGKGEKTRGEIVKVNRKTYKIRTLEQRGNGRGSAPGTIWNVAKSLCELAHRPENLGQQRGRPARRTPSLSVTALIPQQPQRQDSLEDQLRDLRRVGLRLGLYDAVDYLNSL